MSLADKIIASTIKDKDDLGRQVGGAAGSVRTYFNLFRESLQPIELYTRIASRGLGSSFILGHPGLGWVGAEVAGSVAVGSQPYLGDSRGDFETTTVKSVSSPNNIFREYFAGSRFKSGESLALWDNTGSCVFDYGTTTNTVLTSGFGFDATNDKIQFYDPIASNSVFTVDAWINYGSVAQFRMFGNRDVTSRNNGWLLFVTGAGSFAFKTKSFQNETTAYLSGPPSLGWHHTALVFDADGFTGQSGSVALYIDGSLLSRHTGDFNHDQATGSFIFGVGDESVIFFSGVADELRISDNARFTGSPTMSSAPSNTELSTDANTVALYHLNSGAGDGNLIEDVTGNYDGSAVGAVLTTGSVGSQVGGGMGGNYFASSREIYLGSEAVNTVKFTLGGGSTSLLSMEASPDGGQTFESVTTGSVHSFTATGSDLRWKATASGSAYLTKLQAEYTKGG